MDRMKWIWNAIFLLKEKSLLQVFKFYLNFKRERLDRYKNVF